MPFRPGDNLVICDICGLRRYKSECRMTHDNLFVCADTCFDGMHPLLKPSVGLHEKQRAKIRRPEGEDVFITTPVTPDDL